MERLRLRDFQAVSRFLAELYAFRDMDDFVSFALSDLPTVIPSEVTAYGELNLSQGLVKMISSPVDIFAPGLKEAFVAHVHEHPLAQHPLGGGNGEAVKISDLVTRRQFRRTGIYNEGFKKFGMDSEMVVWLLAVRPREITLAVHRARHDFSERDRLLLNLLRPHLTQAYRNAEAVTLLKRAGDAAADCLVLLERPDVVRRSDPIARRLLETYFGRTANGGLPESLRRWVKHYDRLMSATDGIPPPLEPLVVERASTRLVVRLLSGPSQHLLLLKEECKRKDFAALQSLGLTRRQAEILAWVAQGKTNEAIAIILGISERTVAKHLEMMYPRLGVENRTAAAARAFSVLQVGPGRQP